MRIFAGKKAKLQIMVTQEKQDKVFVRDFFRKVGKAIHDYALIAGGDRVLVGVSGGKDSLALLDVLASRAKDPKQRYSVVAAHVDVEEVEYEVDADYLRGFCDSLGVPFVSRSIRVDLERDARKPACFVCSWHRRKVLFDVAREYGCASLALGHHRDDAVESLLMSMIFNAALSSMPARLSLFGGELALIRPLIYLSNEETARYAAIRGFRQQRKRCPHERATNREAVAALLRQAEALAPNVRANLFAAMRNIHSEYLP